MSYPKYNHNYFDQSICIVIAMSHPYPQVDESSSYAVVRSKVSVLSSSDTKDLIYVLFTGETTTLS